MRYRPNASCSPAKSENENVKKTQDLPRTWEHRLSPRSGGQGERRQPRRVVKRETDLRPDDEVIIPWDNTEVHVEELGDRRLRGCPGPRNRRIWSACTRSLGNPSAIYGALRDRIRRHSPDGAPHLTCGNVTRQDQTYPLEATTDQKVRGSNPSERAGYMQVKALLSSSRQRFVLAHPPTSVTNL